MEEAGFHVVDYSTSFDDLSSRIARHPNLIFGRDFRGYSGRDIRIYDPYRQYGKRFPEKPERKHDWYSAFCPSSSEVRLHVCNGKIIRFQRKYCDFPNDMSDYIRNYHNGYRFRAPRMQLRSNKRTAAIGAVEALGLNFGAVDMLMFGPRMDVNRIPREYAILEVNTAPAGSPLTLRCYVSELALQINQLTGGKVHLAPGLLQGEIGEEDL